MGLFGPPDIEKLYKKKNYRGLIKALDHRDPNIVSRAEEALRKLAGDKDAIEARRIWGVDHYNLVLEWIAGMEPAKRSVVEPLFQALELEREDAEKRVAFAKKRFEEVVKQYEKFFGRGSADNRFLGELNAHLGENERIVKATKLMGMHTLSSYGGLLVTNESVIRFDIGIANRFWVVKYGAGTSLEYRGLFKNTLRITDANGWIEFDFNQKNVVDMVPIVKYYSCKAQQEIPSGEFEKENEIEALVQALHDENPHVRKAAVRSFGNIGDSRAVEFVIQAAHDDDFTVSSAAIDIIKDINNKSAVEPLIQVLKDKNHSIRKAATQALVYIGDEKAIAPITNLLKDEKKSVRDAARKALEKIKTRIK